jgi:hypothetical protein
MNERRRTPAERRKSRRVSFVASVLKRVGRELSLALAQDLGESGMQLKRVSGQSYSPQTAMHLQFELPDGGALIRVRGEVVFERAEGSWQTTGIRFENLSIGDRARIERFLDSKLR